MKFDKYEPTKMEPEILKFWREQEIHSKANKKNSEGKPFYFLDGPPYTSGKVHIGTTWNKNMKDMLIRFRRMQGFNIWDRAGYDMHGMPTEHATMEKLGLTSNEDILNLGIAKFTEACRELSVTNLQTMNDDFKRLGVWMDFDDAYQTISDEWIDAVWWVVKKAHKESRLYEGLRSMTWDPKAESALAKHELVYKSVEDMSIFVKFKVKGKNDYLVIWTTTPWTIPFNLMIMVHPEIDYVKVETKEGNLIIAKDLYKDVLERAGLKGKITEEFKGEKLKGVEYEHFFADKFDYAALKKDHPKVHTIVLSKEYVTTEAGSGLVHGAPGCGPEDYEVGVRENIPAFNLLDEKGEFSEGAFKGKKARFEDSYFTEEIEKAGSLLAKMPYVHDYPHAERSKSPVVYKTTKQWFFKVSDLKEKMIELNKQVHWVPKAGFNAFNSWLENLRDNSITRQRFWGTPFPVWRNVEDEDDVIVVGSKAELEELAGKPLESMHRPYIDDIEINKGGKTYKKMTDVMDVWLDAGVASWACLDFPKNQELIKKYFPADFIMEGNDQIRGWFNLLMVAGIIGFDKATFKNVYMHGMINDSKGRKMSKSLGNYITPDEVVDQFGADAVRLYMIGGTRAGNDLNYNHEDCKNKMRNLIVYWNVHNYLIDLIKTTGYKPENKKPELAEKYILSKAQTITRKVKEEVDQYNLDKIPELVETLFSELSRTYIQLIRDKAGTGSQEEQETVITTIFEVLDTGLRLLAPVCPFIAEAMYQSLKNHVNYGEESVHLLTFPEVNEKLIDEKLEEEMKLAQNLISTILAARDKAQIGLRWPLRSAAVKAKALTKDVEKIVLQQTNLKQLDYVQQIKVEYKIEPNFRNLGKEFGEETGDVVEQIKQNAKQIAQDIKQGKAQVGKYELNENHLVITKKSPEGFQHAEDQIEVLLSTAQDDQLIREGYLRELVRRVQQLRKTAELEKKDNIHVYLALDLESLVEPYRADFMAKVGATKITYTDPEKAPHVAREKVKDKHLHFGFFLVDNL